MQSLLKMTGSPVCACPSRCSTSSASTRAFGDSPRRSARSGARRRQESPPRSADRHTSGVKPSDHGSGRPHRSKRTALLDQTPASRECACGSVPTAGYGRFHGWLVRASRQARRAARVPQGPGRLVSGRGIGGRLAPRPTRQALARRRASRGAGRRGRLNVTTEASSNRRLARRDRRPVLCPAAFAARNSVDARHRAVLELRLGLGGCDDSREVGRQGRAPCRDGVGVTGEPATEFDRGETLADRVEPEERIPESLSRDDSKELPR